MATKPATAKLIESDFVAPDLERIRRFIIEAVAEGAIPMLVLALLVRMRDLNQELMRKLAWRSRKRPPSEALQRLQLELPFVVRFTPAAASNDQEPSPENGANPKGKGKRGNKRGAKNPDRRATEVP